MCRAGRLISLTHSVLQYSQLVTKWRYRYIRSEIVLVKFQYQLVSKFSWDIEAQINMKTWSATLRPMADDKKSFHPRNWYRILRRRHGPTWVACHGLNLTCCGVFSIIGMSIILQSLPRCESLLHHCLTNLAPVDILHIHLLSVFVWNWWSCCLHWVV